MRLACIARSWQLLPLSCVFLIHGCDSVAIGTQRFRIQVHEPGRTPLAGRLITYAPEARPGPSTVYSLSEHQYLDGFRDRSRRTDSDGEVEFVIDTQTLRGGIGVWVFGVKLDNELAGERYLFRVEGPQRETLTVPLVPGAHAHGKGSIITVQSVGLPEPR